VDREWPPEENGSPEGERPQYFVAREQTCRLSAAEPCSGGPSGNRRDHGPCLPSPGSRIPELRRRVTIGLNKGKAHHTLKRAIRFYHRRSVNDRTQLERDLHAMALNLVVAAITLWNTLTWNAPRSPWRKEGRRFQRSMCGTSHRSAGIISPPRVHTTGAERSGDWDDSGHCACISWTARQRKGLSGSFLPRGPVWPRYSIAVVVP